jgi:hypothetical protein
MALTPEDFGASFKGFMQRMAAEAPAEDPVFVRRLREHFGCEPAGLPVITENFDKHEHPNVHTAIEAYVAGDGRSAQVVGVTSPMRLMGVSLSELVAPAGAGLMGGQGATEGPVQYVNVPLDGDRVLSCVQRGLYLVRDRDEWLAVLVVSEGDFRPYATKLKVEVMAPDKARAERFLADLRTALRQRNVYRGQILSLAADEHHTLEVHFHRLPKIARDSIILPEGLLDRIERQAIRFGQYREKLLAAGRHLKRGLLLYGPPGTGKTLTAMYLAGEIRDRTVLLLTGRGLGLIEQSCALARSLQPATVILEDVDLVAEERVRGRNCATPLLFELLNQMDGLADDADVLFLLTTNRPDLLEPALAARPGRVDQAFEIPLPDAACRRRLVDLYGHGLTLRLAELPRFIDRTQGASAAFIREWIRKAALFAADEGAGIVIEDRHLDEALHELTVQGGELTKSLLGFRSLGFHGAKAAD